MLRIDAATLAVLIGSVVPMLVALVVKINAPSWFKSLANVALSFAAGVLAVLLQHPEGLPYKQCLLAGFLALFTSQTSYTTFWKALGIAPKAQELAPAGIGPTAEASNLLEPDYLTPESMKALLSLNITGDSSRFAAAVMKVISNHPEYFEDIARRLVLEAEVGGTLTLESVQRFADGALFLEEPQVGDPADGDSDVEDLIEQVVEEVDDPEAGYVIGLAPNRGGEGVEAPLAQHERVIPADADL